MSAIERILVVSLTGAKQITTPQALWGEDTVRSTFDQVRGFKRHHYQLAKQLTRLKALVYKEVGEPGADVLGDLEGFTL